MLAIKTKNIFFNILKYSLYFIVFYLFSLARITGLSPSFNLAFFVSLIWCNNNVVVCFCLLAFATVLTTINVFNLCCILVSASIFMLLYFIYYKRKKPLSVKALIAYYPLVLLPFIVWTFFNLKTIVFSIISIFISFVAFVVMLIFFDAVAMRKNKLNLSTDELFLGGVVLLILGLGLSNFNIAGFNVGLILGLFICLFTALFKNKSISLVTSICLGLGFLISSNGYEPLILFSVITLSFVALVESGRYFALIISSATSVVLIYYFNLVQSYNLAICLSFIAIILLCTLIPKKVINTISSIYYSKKTVDASEQIMKNFQRVLHAKMFNASNVFNNLITIFEPLERKGIKDEQAVATLANEMCLNMCENCDNKIFCHRKAGFNVDKTLKEVFSNGLIKGKVSLLDVPPSLTTNCNKAGLLINEANDMLKRFSEYRSMEENTIFYQNVISNELKMGARLLTKTAERLNENVVLNKKLENKIYDELIYNNILLEEVLVLNETNNFLSVNIVIKKDVYDETAIVEAISKVLKTKMEITKMDALEDDKIMLELHPCAAFNLVFGVSSKSKLENALCGDKHSILKVDNSNVLISLCDGMGSGDKASNLSDMAMGLIENFYKAGLSINETAKAVNDILLITQETDGFNAIDILSLNLYNGAADFIKLATPVSFIKKSNGVEQIKSEALPLGIVEETKEVVIKKVLEPGDLIVMITDGIFDVLGEKVLQKIILSTTEKNPQQIADLIMEKALLTCKNAPPDDMTVLCIRVFKKV